MGEHTATINQETLQDLTGYQKTSDIAAHLAKNGIPYFIGKRKRIWTTVEAVNASLLGFSKCDERDHIEVE